MCLHKAYEKQALSIAGALLARWSQLGVQVTCLEIHIHNEVDSERTAPNKEAAVAALACIVVACSARLTVLDLRLDWQYTDGYAEELLVRQTWLSPRH